MAAVTLDVFNEQNYLGFDMVEAQVEAAKIGDVVSLSYDFGTGPRKIVGTYEGTETRDSGEVFIWVMERDQGHTRYAIPEGMVEAMRVEAKGTDLPTIDGDDRQPNEGLHEARRNNWRDRDDHEDFARCEVCDEPIDYCQGHGEIAETAGLLQGGKHVWKTEATPPAKRHSLSESHHMRAAHGRACARLDYEGQVAI